MTWLSLVNGLAGLLKGLLDWWRSKSDHDAGVNAERLRVIRAEQKAQADAEKIKPLDRDGVVSKLRDGGF